MCMQKTQQMLSQLGHLKDEESKMHFINNQYISLSLSVRLDSLWCVWMTWFSLGYSNPNIFVWEVKKKMSGISKSTKNFKPLKCLNLKWLLKPIDLKSRHFKSINLKSKFKFPNTALVYFVLMNKLNINIILPKNE